MFYTACEVSYLLILFSNSLPLSLSPGRPQEAAGGGRGGGARPAGEAPEEAQGPHGQAQVSHNHLYFATVLLYIRGGENRLNIYLPWYVRNCAFRVFFFLPIFSQAPHVNV